MPVDSSNDKLILGIDPGTIVMGYGILSQTGSQLKLESLGVLKLEKLASHELKLKHIFDRTSALIKEYKPDEMAIEAPFFGKNVQSMLKLGRAQGVAMAAALHHNIPIFEYSPRKIKMSITGNGNASKEQVAAMLKSILNFGELPSYLDATDGLAVALCHHFQNKVMRNNKSNYSGWKSFLSENPQRKV